MNTSLSAALLATALVAGATSASAITVNPGQSLGFQVLGSYATLDGNVIREGSQLQILGFATQPAGFDAFISGVSTQGGADAGTLSAGDPVSDLVGDIITVSTGVVPTFGFIAEPAGEALSFIAVSKVATATTVIPVAANDDTVLEGFGTIDGLEASWSFSIAGDAPSAGFSLFINTPPTISEVPLPASVLTLGGGLALLGFFGHAVARSRRKAA